jgi:dGTPase
VTNLAERFRVPPDRGPKKAHDSRSAAAKDRDRIIHSSAFRRLQGKSQIVGVEVGDFFRTRITHSLECAQIGRSIANSVTGDPKCTSAVEAPSDLPDVVEAACLAHDLGHPPFGHTGEDALRERMKHYNDSLFEGNAQSFRIVTLLEPKAQGFKTDGGARWFGLDLSRATLRGLLKYPILETDLAKDDPHPKFGVYDDPVDREYYDWIWDGGKPERTPTAAIMDAADEIAYAIHDAEDGVWAGMIPLQQLIRNEAIVTELLDREELFYIKEAGYDRSRDARAAVKNWTAALVGEFIAAATTEGIFSEPDDAGLGPKLLVLKAMAWQWMIERTDIETHKFGQRRLIKGIFDGYWEHPDMLPSRDEWLLCRDSRPSDAKDDDPWPSKARLIRDHIAGMTDGYARDVYDQMYRATQRRNLHLAY